MLDEVTTLQGVPALHHVVLSMGGRTAFRDVLGASAFKSWTSVDSSVPHQLGPHKVDGLLGISALEPHTVELLEPGRHIDPREYVGAVLGSGQILRRTLAADYVSAAVAAGATLVINGADRFDPCIMSNREYLEYLVGAICWCNVYFSQTTQSPFGRHSDAHDVLVVHGGGEKRWTVSHPETGDAVFDRMVTTGDVLYIPRGWDHEVSGTGKPSTHWTFGFNRAGIQWTALSTISNKVRDRCFDGLSATEFAQVVQHELLHLLCLDDPFAETRDFTERRAGGCLAYSGPDVPLERVSVRMAPRIPPVILPAAEDNAFRLLAASKVFRIGERLRPAFELLMIGTEVAVTTLATQCAVDNPRRLIEWGIANGVLIASVTP